MLVVLYACAYACAYAYVDAYVARFSGVLSLVLPCAYAYVASENQALRKIYRSAIAKVECGNKAANM